MQNPQSELIEIFVKSIRNIIHGNHVDGVELQLKEGKVIPFNLRVSITWDFQAHWRSETIAGGHGATINHGQNESSFDRQHEAYVNDAKYNKQNRYQFLNEFKNYGVEGLTCSSSDKTIKQYPSHSFWYNCSNCKGNGDVTCSGCHGSGRTNCHSCGGSGTTTETRYETDTWNNTTRTVITQISCFSCGGSGRDTCTGCRGSGRQQCSPCSGHGFFTYYRHTSVVAVPTAKYLLKSDEYADKLVNHLMSLNLSFLYEKISFNQFDMAQDGDTSELIRYYGNSFITDILTELRQQKHHILGYSNPPIPFQRSAIFDQLFIEEITALETLQNKSGKISKAQALKFFNEFAGQPVLDKALKNIAQERKVSQVDHSNIVSKACSYFITDIASKRLADGIHSILDKVSPAYHGLTWAVLSSLFFLICAILVEFKVEGLHLFSFGKYFLTTFKFIFFAMIVFVLCSVLISLLSTAITIFKRRNVPTEYRQSLRNMEAFHQSWLFGVFFLILASFYGYSSLKQWTPKLEYKLISKVYSVANIVLPSNSVQNLCVLWSKKVSRYDFPHICTSKHFINVQDEFNVRLFNQPVEFIQQKLRLDDPNLKVDGVMGQKTRDGAQQWLKKRGIEISANASVDELASKMDDLEKPY